MRHFLQMMKMEATLRGYVEQVIDEGLKTEVLENALEFLKRFEPLVKSETDVMFGHVIGTVRMSIFYYALALYHRTPTEEELNDVCEIMQRRAQEIKSKILMVTMK